jgi:hypothetical protein
MPGPLNARTSCGPAGSMLWPLAIGAADTPGIVIGGHAL